MSINLIIATAAIAFLLFMLALPTVWSVLVDKENQFWVRTGLVSESFAEAIKRFEKGIGMKLLVGGIAVLSLIIEFFGQ